LVWSRISVFLGATLQPALAQETSPPNICKVVNAPALFEGHVIELKARYRSDGMESEGISDTSCGGTAIPVVITHDAKGSEAFFAALNTGYRGTADKVVFATFTGSVHYAPGKHPSVYLAVEKIADISATLKHIVR
jgi:hypothetical protein